jgi:hypothetical protein
MSEWFYDARYWISRPGRMSWKRIHLSSLAILILCHWVSFDFANNMVQLSQCDPDPHWTATAVSQMMLFIPLVAAIAVLWASWCGWRILATWWHRERITNWLLLLPIGCFLLFALAQVIGFLNSWDVFSEFWQDAAAQARGCIRDW